MKHLSQLIAVIVAASGLVAAQPVDSAAAAAVQKAEHFVVRHGYTAAGHPEDQPVENASLFDALYSREKLVARRQGMLSQNAACVRTHPDGSHTVLFQSAGDPEEFWFVALNIGEQPYLGHQPVSRSADCAAIDGAAP